MGIPRTYHRRHSSALKLRWILDQHESPADILARPVVAAPITEITALGAAYAAGLAVGFWTGLDELRSMDRAGQRWEPSMDQATRTAGIARWHKGVERTLGWVEPGA